MLIYWPKDIDLKDIELGVSIAKTLGIFIAFSSLWLWYWRIKN